MTQFVFKKFRDTDNKFDTSTVTFEVETENKGELEDCFYEFLAACGFSVKDREPSED